MQSKIEVDGVNYDLYDCDPLKQLWSEGNYIQLSYHDSDEIYCAHWLLEDDILWLIEIKSSFFGIEDIFPNKNGKKIKADWFTGNIKYILDDNDSPFHNYNIDCEVVYTRMSLVNGNYVKETRIEVIHITSMPEIVLDFGKHKGREVKDVITGLSIDNEDHVVLQYLLDAFDVYAKGHSRVFNDHYLPAPVDPRIVHMMKSLRINSSWALKRKNNTLFVEDDGKDEVFIREFWQNIVECFSKSFYTSEGISYYNQSGNTGRLAKTSLLIKSDAQYVRWIVNEVKTLLLPPHMLDQTYQCRDLASINIELVDSFTINYRPIVYSFSYNFPKDVVKTCANKFYNRYGWRYNSDEKIYVRNYKKSTIECEDISFNAINQDELYFDAMTDGQLGDYENFRGDIDDIETWARG